MLFLQLDAAATSQGYGIIAFHVQDGYHWEPGSPIPSTAIQPILFLNKALTARERLYGPSELEVGCLAWAARKLRVMMKSSKHPVVILIKGIVEKTTLQTTSTDRANRRLINASIYLSEYDLQLFHIPGRINTVPNALSRLPAKRTPDEEADLLANANNANLDNL